MAAHAQSLDSLQHVEEVVITGHIVRREVIPVQDCHLRRQNARWNSF